LTPQTRNSWELTFVPGGGESTNNLFLRTRQGGETQLTGMHTSCDGEDL
jgi:hypothetical protein